MYLERLRGKRVVILDLEEALLLPFLEPIVGQLCRKTTKITYFATFKTSRPKIGDLTIPPTRWFTFDWSQHMFAANLFLSPHIYGKASERVLKVHVPHGHPVKFSALPKEQFERYDVHFVTSSLHREQTEFTIASYGIKRNIQIYNVGLPKSDKLLSGQYDRHLVLASLGLDTSRATVIYAPSWEEGLSLRTFRERLFEEFARLDDFNVIIKLHPASSVPREHPDYFLYTGGYDWTTIIRDFLRDPHIRHVVTDYVDPLLAASDVLITDISSVAFDFLCQLKPVIYLDCPEFFDKTLPTLYRDFGANSADYVRNDPKSNAGRHVGYIVEQIEELPQAINFVLNHPEYKLLERQEYAKQLRYNPGCAAKVAANVILQLLGLPSHVES